MGALCRSRMPRTAERLEIDIFYRKTASQRLFSPERTKNALYPRFLGDRGQILRSELFLQSIKLLPDPLVLIVRVRVECDPLGSVLLLGSLKLREDFTVGADLLTLQLLGVGDVGEKFADVVQLAAESVDIIAQIRGMVIVRLVFHGLDNSADLAHASMKVFQLGVDLALDHFQIRDHNADPHH